MTSLSRNNGEKTVGWAELCQRLATADANERARLVPIFLMFARCW